MACPAEIEALARQDQACSRLMTVPGIGPIISSAHGGRDRHWRRLLQRPAIFGAWLGAGAQADLDGRPYDPRQNLQAR